MIKLEGVRDPQIVREHSRMSTLTSKLTALQGKSVIGGLLLNNDRDKLLEAIAIKLGMADNQGKII